MSHDFISMQNRIIDDTLRDDLGNQIKNAINDAVKAWEGQRFVFNEKRYRILTVANQEYYDLTGPTLLTSAGAAVATGERILELDDIFTTVSNNSYRLCPRTQQWFNEWQQPNNNLSQPDSYTLYGDQLRIFPIPDQVYTLDLMGLARLGPNPLTVDDDTNAWLTEGEMLIRGQAEVLLYRDVIRDTEGVTIALGLVSEGETSLRRKMGAQAFTGRQRAWDL